MFEKSCTIDANNNQFRISTGKTYIFTVGSNKPNLKTFGNLLYQHFQVSVKQREVFLDKPIHIGFTVLEKSKLIMADFWYGVVLPLFGEDNVKLLYTGQSYFEFKLLS